MSENKQQNLSKNRMDKFLYYAKFGLLIIVALLFMIGYSFFQQELPASTAELHPDSSHEIYKSCATALIVIDFENYYQQNNFTNISFVNNIVHNIEDLDYDVLLLGESKEGGTVLDNIDKGLLLRVYKQKKYDYIIAIDDNAIIPAIEIQSLFLPQAKILTYNAVNNTLFPAIDLVDTETYVKQTIDIAVDINFNATKLLFIHNELILSPSSKSILDVANQYVKQHNGLSYDTLYIDHSNINKLIDQINKQSDDTLLFYVSPDLHEENSAVKHASIIHKLQLYTNQLVYDLSPISQSEYTRTSIRYYPTGNTDKPIAYIALAPEGVNEFNYELIDFAIANIDTSDFSDTSSYISWCIENIGFSQFPDTLQSQYNYCMDHSLFIEEYAVQSGDLVFYSTPENSGATGAAVYINDNIVLIINQMGILSFTQLKSEEYAISFAHPYSFLETQVD